jgi:hypothetical protein
MKRMINIFEFYLQQRGVHHSKIHDSLVLIPCFRYRKSRKNEEGPLGRFPCNGQENNSSSQPLRGEGERRVLKNTEGVMDVSKTDGIFQQAAENGNPVHSQQGW